MRSLVSLGAVGLILAASPCRAEIKSIRVGVDGITCPTCSFGLEKGLKRLTGVAKTQIDTSKASSVEITLKPGTWLEPASVFKSIKNTGFEPRKGDLHYTLVGKLERDGSALKITVDSGVSSSLTFRIVQSTGGDPKTLEARTKAFEEAGKMTGGTVEVLGHWQLPAKGAAGSDFILALTRVKAVSTTG